MRLSSSSLGRGRVPTAGDEAEGNTQSQDEAGGADEPVVLEAHAQERQEGAEPEDPELDLKPVVV
jgi:hypothetical protein